MALQQVFCSVLAELEKSWCHNFIRNREDLQSKLDETGHQIMLLENGATFSLKGTLKAIIAAEGVLHEFFSVDQSYQESSNQVTNSSGNILLENKSPRVSESPLLNSCCDYTCNNKTIENCIHIELFTHVEEESTFDEYCTINLQQGAPEPNNVKEAQSYEELLEETTERSLSSPPNMKQSSKSFFPLKEALAIQHKEGQQNSSGNSSDTNTEAGEEFYCTLCSYKTHQKKLLRRHMKAHFNEEQKKFTELFSCQKCCYKTTRKVHYVRHVRGVHDDKRPHLCDLCGKAFKRQDNLKQHRLLHLTPETYATNSAPFQCDVCDKICHSKAHLREHQAVHSTVRSFLCEICGASFKTLSVQRKHVITVHRNPRSFACKICSKRFNTNYALRRHMKQHPYEMGSLESGNTDTSLSQQEKVTSTAK